MYFFSFLLDSLFMIQSSSYVSLCKTQWILIFRYYWYSVDGLWPQSLKVNKKGLLLYSTKYQRTTQLITNIAYCFSLLTFFEILNGCFILTTTAFNFWLLNRLIGCGKPCTPVPLQIMNRRYAIQFSKEYILNVNSKKRKGKKKEEVYIWTI